MLKISIALALAACFDSSKKYAFFFLLIFSHRLNCAKSLEVIEII